MLDPLNSQMQMKITDSSGGQADGTNSNSDASRGKLASMVNVENVEPESESLAQKITNYFSTEQLLSNQVQIEEVQDTYGKHKDNFRRNAGLQPLKTRPDQAPTPESVTSPFKQPDRTPGKLMSSYRLPQFFVQSPELKETFR